MSKRFQLSSAMLIVGLVMATSATAEITPAENRCQAKLSKIMVKYGTSVAKCGVRCQRDARRGRVPYSDCFAPYGGRMNACIYDPLIGKQVKAVTGIRKACDPAIKPTADCPECYDGGDCASFAENWV